MKISNQPLSYRYKKNFFINRSRFKKISDYITKFEIDSHSSCPLCSYNKFTKIAEVDRVGFPCDTLICNKCGLVFNNSFIRNIGSLYSKDFSYERWEDPYESFKKRTRGDAFSWRRYNFLKGYLKNKDTKNRILEIGCGDGCNLYPFFKEGESVVGCDFSEDFLLPGREVGLDLRNGDFKEILDQNSTFDIIMLVHSFEHFLDLNDQIQSIREFCSDETIIYVEVPGIRNWNRIKSDFLSQDGFVSSNNFLDYIQYQHNYNFELTTLTQFWTTCGFELLYGDEWVRAIFKPAKEIDSDWYSKFDIFKYLNDIEKDYLFSKDYLREIKTNFRDLIRM